MPKMVIAKINRSNSVLSGFLTDSTMLGENTTLNLHFARDFFYDGLELTRKLNAMDKKFVYQTWHVEVFQ